MIFFKKHYLQKQISRLAFHRMEKAPRFLSIDVAEKVGILISYSSIEEWEKDKSLLIQWQQNQRAKIQFVVYIDDNLKTINNNECIKIVAKNHFSIFGHLNHQYTQDLMQEKFDILIDINTNTNLPILYLQFLSDSILRIGRDSEKIKFYNLVIQTDSSICIVEHLTEVEKYLKQLSA